MEPGRPVRFVDTMPPPTEAFEEPRSPVSALSAASTDQPISDDARLVALRAELLATQQRSAALEATMQEIMRAPPPVGASASAAAELPLAVPTDAPGAPTAVFGSEPPEPVDEQAPGGTILTTITEVR